MVLTAGRDDHRRVREPLSRGLSPERVAAADAVAGMKRVLDAHVRSRADADDLCSELARAIEPHGTFVSHLRTLMLAGHLTTGRGPGAHERPDEFDELPGLRLDGSVEILPNLIHRSPKELVLTR